MPRRIEDFSPATRRAVAERVANYCSKPDCEVQTAGPHTQASKTNNVGVAAHIEGARPGSARFNSSLSLEEIKSPKNAIWLCQTHADLIDNDEVAYPVDLLRQWKAQAEAKAAANMGKPRSNQGREALLERAYEDALGYYRAGWRVRTAIDKYGELTNNEKANLFDRLYQSETGSLPHNPYKVKCETCSKEVLPTEVVSKQYSLRSFENGTETYTVRVCSECASPEKWIAAERKLQNQVRQQHANNRRNRRPTL